MCHHINNPAINQFKDAQTGPCWDLLTTIISTQFIIRPRLVRIFRIFRRLYLMGLVTIWPRCLIFLSMVTLTKHIPPKWATMWLSLSQKLTHYSRTQPAIEKLVHLVNPFSRLNIWAAWKTRQSDIGSTNSKKMHNFTSMSICICSELCSQYSKRCFQ